jgi:hypothetical protein
VSANHGFIVYGADDGARDAHRFGARAWRCLPPDVQAALDGRVTLEFIQADVKAVCQSVFVGPATTEAEVAAVARRVEPVPLRPGANHKIRVNCALGNETTWVVSILHECSHAARLHNFDDRPQEVKEGEAASDASRWWRSDVAAGVSITGTMVAPAATLAGSATVAAADHPEAGRTGFSSTRCQLAG